jgi:Heavy metal associated domain 2
MAPPALAIVHSIQGRVRLRLPSTTPVPGLVDAVRAVPGVTEAAWSPRTCGLLVRYRPDDTTPAAIIQAVASQTGIPAPSHVTPAEVSDEPVPVAITSAVSTLNARVARATGGRLDLGVLVPLALTAWAVRELLRAQVTPLAWSSALWYAHGLFRDYMLQERP